MKSDRDVDWATSRRAAGDFDYEVAWAGSAVNGGPTRALPLWCTASSATHAPSSMWAPGRGPTSPPTAS